MAMPLGFLSLEARSAQVAIITGSGQGLGAAAAKLFAEHGAKVVVSDLDAGKAEKVGTALVARGPSRAHMPQSCWPVADGGRDKGGWR